MKDKALPYFGNTLINAITAPMIRKRKGEMMDKGFKPTYEECHREVEQAVRGIMEKEGVDERLKAENPLEWVRRVNGIKMCVEAEVERRLCLK